MKAIAYHEYGSVDVLELDEIERPTVGNDEVLVHVLGAAVNPGDWFLLHGTPYLLRLGSGLRKPRKEILGLAIAGKVAAIGAEVTRFRPGDEVFGEVRSGGFAEYVGIPEEALARKPSNLTFEEAAAVPVVGVTALQALRDVAEVEPGQKVLITGASGGVGTFALQIAKAFGAEVTGVCSTGNLELVRAIGADHAIDYTKEDFTAGGARYDVILDNVGNLPLSHLRRALVPGGLLIPNANSEGRWIGGYLRRAIQALVMAPFVPQRFRPFSAHGSSEDLAVLTQMIESGTVTPIIDRTYPFDETATALDYYGKGHSRGKVVITV